MLAIYSLCVALASLLGGWALIAMRLTHAGLQVAVSFVAGLMLSMALLHFIPHATHLSDSPNGAMEWTLAGFLMMFFLQRFLPYHHHDVPQGAPGHPPALGDLHAAKGLQDLVPHSSAEGLSGGLSSVGTILGMSLHSVMGGFALAAAVIEETGQHSGVLVGLATALVIILHKPFDAVAVSTVMAASGYSRHSRHLMNGAFALLTPAGALLFYMGASRAAHMDPAFLGAALAFCAGTFLCIACADLLPELQFHSHDRLKLSLALAAGLGIAILIGQLEPSAHDHLGLGPGGSRLAATPTRSSDKSP